MIIKLESNLFNDEPSFGYIDRIFYLIEDGKHTWRIDDDQDFDLILDSLWLNNHLDRVKASVGSILEKAFIESNNYDHKNILLISKSDAEKSLGLLNAIQYLNEPLFILVENEISDFVFLRCLSNSFRRKGKKIRKALQNDWLRPYNAGGKSMISKLVNMWMKKNPLMVRFLVFCDSDKVSPSEIPSETQLIIDLCKENDIYYHVLEKREIENYLPDEVLLHVPHEMLRIVRTLSTLNARQRDFYDMEKGFRSFKHDIFNDIDNTTFNTLRNGLFSSTFNPKKELYLLFENNAISRKNLLERCVHQDEPNELENILDKISSLL